MNWSRYYTPVDLCSVIVDKVNNDFVPEIIVDICVGSGNMLKAGLKKWPKAKLVGIDLVISNDLMHLYEKKSSIDLYEFDALRIDQLKKLFDTKRKKIILANPPFGNIKYTIKKELSNLNRVHELALKTNRIEALMLVSNLSIMNDGDYLGAVLPENIFSSEKMHEFKNEFMSLFSRKEIINHQVKFDKSEVRTRIFIGQYCLLNYANEQYNTYKRNLTNNSHPMEKYCLIRGIDNSLISAKKEDVNELNEVIHFNNSAGEISNYRYIDNSFDKYTAKKVNENDLIVVRVGRNSGTVVLPRTEHVGRLISDHLILIKNGKKLGSENILKVNNYLNLNKGLTTKYITFSDIHSAIDKATL